MRTKQFLLLLAAFISLQGGEAWVQPRSCRKLPTRLYDVTADNSIAYPSQAAQEEHRLRFSSVGRLYDNENVDVILERLQKATVAVVGVGGVGSWSAEALVRSGIGSIVLIDLDDICISNTNRQLHALSSTVGQMKIDEMKRRLLDINPHLDISLIHDFVSVDNVHSILQSHNLTMVLDAMDGGREKSALLAACVDCSIPIVTCGGAAGRVDPTQIVVHDLTRVKNDKLLRTCRGDLRKLYGFERGDPFHIQKLNPNKRQKWNIDCVYSLEPQKEVADDSSSFRRCDGALGTACFLTGTYGFVAAARVIDKIATDSLVVPSKGLIQ
jgi:tRNA A37 threonylcarbamoyladenosine dehydratase